MRHVLRISIGIAILALAGCVYPGYTYVRGDYGGGYYTGNVYYDDGYAPVYGYGDYGCCGWYGPSVSIGLGYYGGGYYRHGYRGYYGHGWSGSWRGRGPQDHGRWRGGDSHGHGRWHRGDSHGGDDRHR